MIRLLLFLIIFLQIKKGTAQTFVFQNEKIAIDARVKDLLNHLTIKEKIQLLSYDNKTGVPRLQIPAYNWWNEALHGVGRAGKATVFPQPIAMAASFNKLLIYDVATAISDEARAKFNEAVKIDNRTQYLGLTFWSPNINIFRDPRWGRGHETWGEDPYLTGELGSAFVNGLQGNDKQYYKTIACAKHFAVHSGPEPLRHEFNAQPSKADLYNTYLPAFEKLVTKAKVGSVMCAYNALDGKPCCVAPFLLDTILRQQWKFDGYLVTDCWALSDVVGFHKYVKNDYEAAALAIKNKVNVECGNTLQHLEKALNQNLITEKEIDIALAPNIKTLIKLGLLDNKGKQFLKHLNQSTVSTAAYTALAKKCATESMVLLVNKNNTLPLSKNTKTILVTGPNANDNTVMLGNYNGFSSNVVTYLEGIVNKVNIGTQVQYDKGCELLDNTNPKVPWEAGFAETIIAVMGLSPLMEGENGDAKLSTAGGDKENIFFPKNQLAFLKNIKEKYPNKKLIVLITTGSAIELNEIANIADAVLLCWYAGEQGGNAAADIVFGEANPSGKLPITFYDSQNDLPSFENYSMQNRTYRYIAKQPQFNFGFGLSYAQFETTNINGSIKNNNLIINGNIKNKSTVDGAATIQVFAKHQTQNEAAPFIELKQFKKIEVKNNGATNFEIIVDSNELRLFNNTNYQKLKVADYRFFISLDGKNMLPLILNL